MENAKAVRTPLATHFKLSAKQSPSNEIEKSDMQQVPYASVVGSLMSSILTDLRLIIKIRPKLNPLF